MNWTLLTIFRKTTSIVNGLVDFLQFILLPRQLKIRNKFKVGSILWKKRITRNSTLTCSFSDKRPSTFRLSTFKKYSISSSSENDCPLYFASSWIRRNSLNSVCTGKLSNSPMASFKTSVCSAIKKCSRAMPVSDILDWESVFVICNKIDTI